MLIQTSRNKTYDVRYVDGPARLSGTLMIRLNDQRNLLEIGAEFNGIEWLRRISANQGDKEWRGYSSLVMIKRATENDVIIELAKP